MFPPLPGGLFHLEDASRERDGECSDGPPGQGRRRARDPLLRRALEVGLDPVHVRPQLLADGLDLVRGALLAQALERALGGWVDPATLLA